MPAHAVATISIGIRQHRIERVLQGFLQQVPQYQEIGMPGQRLQAQPAIGVVSVLITIPAAKAGLRDFAAEKSYILLLPAQFCAEFL